MPEQGMPATPASLAADSRARPAHRKACSRCRKRKIRCDLALPSCQACARAGARCMAYNDARNEVPRSVVSHLEEQVARLESRLQVHEEAGGLERRHPVATISHWHTTVKFALASAVADAPVPLSTSDVLIQTTFRTAFHLHPSRLPRPMQAWQSAHGPSDIRPKKATFIREVPRVAVDLLLTNYTEIHLPQYPCISETDLVASLKKCTAAEEAETPFDILVVSLAMAISASTMMWQSEEHALLAASGFWTMARTQLELPGLLQEPVQHLQYLLLMAHYGFTNPGAVDVWFCIGDAIRLCMQLGYHQDTLAGADISPVELDSRRRLFWTACGMEWAICSYMRIPPSITHESIAAQFPSSLSDFAIHSSETEGPPTKASALHMLNFRQLEMEVLRVLYIEPLDSGWSFEEWSANIEQRLNLWHQEALGFAARHQLEFRDIQYHFLRGRLHRPTPKVLRPSQSSRRICVESAKALTEDYNRQGRRRRLFYPWHAGHIQFEAAIYLLDTAWSCAQWLAGLGLCPEIAQCIRDCPPTLRMIAKAWPGLDACAVAFEELSAPVLQRLDNIIKHGFIASSPEDETVSAQIGEYLFPMAEIGTQTLNVDNVSQEATFDFNLDDIDWGLVSQPEHLHAGGDILASYLVDDACNPGLDFPPLP